jgi:cyclomaltodextrinase / maltogenic alpha-amylase / neopullulanase
VNRLKIGFIILLLVVGISGCSKHPYSQMHSRQSAPWVKSAVVYQVYPRAFSHEGTLKSIEAQLPELQKLGVTVLSFLPIHPIGELNRRGKLGSPYAVKDYYGINPEYGSANDFKELISSAHALGLHVIMDSPIGTAAWDSPMLMEHPEWFVQNAEGAIVSPNDEWIDVAQMDLNRHEVRKYVIMMLKHWVGEFGIDGFVFSRSDFAPVEFWEVIRQELETIKPLMLIAQESDPAFHLKAFDVSNSKRYSQNLPLVLDGTLAAYAFQDSLLTEIAEYPHAAVRELSFAGFDEPMMRRQWTSSQWLSAAVLQFTLPGIPALLNGEETGVQQTNDPFGKLEINWSAKSSVAGDLAALIALRNQQSALQEGAYSKLSNSDSAAVISFLRISNTDSVMVVINVTGAQRSPVVQFLQRNTSAWQNCVTGTHIAAADSGIPLILSPWQYVIYRTKSLQ